VKTWHKWGLALGVLLAVASWGIALYYWGRLPSVIPTHFGFNGQADAWNTKSIWWAFLIPALQALMAGGFIFLYYHPQYSDMPTTLWLMTMEEHKREHAFDLIRTMIVGIGLWIALLFTYITFVLNTAALNEGLGMDPWLLLAIVGGMIVWLTWWTARVYRATKEAMSK